MKPCDHQLLGEHLEDLLDGRLPEPLRAACETSLAACPDCRQVHERALELRRLAGQWRDEAVPAWPRGRALGLPPPRPLPWQSWASLTLSGLALVMVLLQGELRLDDGLHISFGGSAREAELRQALAEDLLAFQSQRDALLGEQFAAFAQGQSTANQLLLRDWLERSREERRQELGLLLAAWQDQQERERRQLDERLDYVVATQIENNDFLNDLLRRDSLRP